jgi:hypothetical protein
MYKVNFTIKKMRYFLNFYIFGLFSFLPNYLLAQQTLNKKFDIKFQLIAEIKNINKPCLPCGRIGNATIDSLNYILQIDYCNKVKIAKNPARYQYFVKFKNAENLEKIIVQYQNTTLIKSIAVY